MMVEKPAVSSLLFDLDGTLVDSLPDLTDAVNVMLSHFGLAERTPSDVLQWVGKGADRLVQQALSAAGPGGQRASDDDAYEVFLRAYERRVCVRSKLYPGVIETLNVLVADGYRLACVTNKPYTATVSVLQGLGIDGFFSAVIGGDSQSSKKPDPEILFNAARNLDTPMEECIMIGDSENDVHAARAAGIEVVCVSYGYNHGRDIRESGPDATIGGLDELPSWLTERR